MEGVLDLFHEREFFFFFTKSVAMAGQGDNSWRLGNSVSTCTHHMSAPVSIHQTGMTSSINKRIVGSVLCGGTNASVKTTTTN